MLTTIYLTTKIYKTRHNPNWFAIKPPWCICIVACWCYFSNSTNSSSSLIHLTWSRTYRCPNANQSVFVFCLATFRLLFLLQFFSSSSEIRPKRQKWGKSLHLGFLSVSPLFYRLTFILLFLLYFRPAIRPESLKSDNILINRFEFNFYSFSSIFPHSR